MALRIKSKWHRSKRERNRPGANKSKTLEDLSSVIAFNIWKIAQEAFKRMEKEGFRFAEDKQAVDVITEFIAFLVHCVDRMIYQNIDEEKRGPFITNVATHLAKTMASNQEELLGPGDYMGSFIATLNNRFDIYSECEFTEEGPSYEFRRFLAQNISDIMAITDKKWVLEQIMDIESPQAFSVLKRLVQDVLGVGKKTTAEK